MKKQQHINPSKAFRPVILDVREDREAVEEFIKMHNTAKGSKFIKPSYSLRGLSYNSSTKYNT